MRSAGDERGERLDAVPAGPLLRCPECREVLPESGDGIACPRCGRTIQRDGCILRVDRLEGYCGPVPRDVLRRAIASARHAGTDAALGLLDCVPPAVQRVLAGHGHADWRWYLEPARRAAALVVGSGAGGAVRELAEWYPVVVSCEPTTELLDWQVLCATEAAAARLVWIQSRVDRLPLADSQFDLVALDSWQEALAVGSGRGPCDTQPLRRLFGECLRLLRPHGWLYVGTRNPWSWAARRRRATLPQFCSPGVEAVLRYYRRVATARRCERWLRAAGFGTIRPYWVFPGLARPIASGRLEQPRTMVEYYRTKGENDRGARLILPLYVLLAKLRWHRWLMPDLFFLCRRGA